MRRAWGWKPFFAGKKPAKILKNGFTLTELGFVLAIIVLFILLLTPFISNIRDRVKLMACEQNLQKIAVGLKVYAIEHEGKFPASLAELTEGRYLGDEKIFDCPSGSGAGKPGESDYQYVSGYNILSPSLERIVFDKAGNHKKGRYVLYINGDVVWEKSNI